MKLFHGIPIGLRLDTQTVSVERGKQNHALPQSPRFKKKSEAIGQLHRGFADAVFLLETKHPVFEFTSPEPRSVSSGKMSFLLPSADSSASDGMREPG
jgi:hypothetical protein